MYLPNFKLNNIVYIVYLVTVVIGWKIEKRCFGRFLEGLSLTTFDQNYGWKFLCRNSIINGWKFLCRNSIIIFHVHSNYFPSLLLKINCQYRPSQHPNFWPENFWPENFWPDFTTSFSPFHNQFFTPFPPRKYHSNHHHFPFPQPSHFSINVGDCDQCWRTLDMILLEYNVGILLRVIDKILLRGIDKCTVERGRILCKPKSIKPKSIKPKSINAHSKFIAEVYALKRWRKTSPFFSLQKLLNASKTHRLLFIVNYIFSEIIYINV